MVINAPTSNLKYHAIFPWLFHHFPCYSYRSWAVSRGNQCKVCRKSLYSISQRIKCSNGNLYYCDILQVRNLCGFKHQWVIIDYVLFSIIVSKRHDKSRISLHLSNLTYISISVLLCFKFLSFILKDLENVSCFRLKVFFRFRVVAFFLVENLTSPIISNECLALLLLLKYNHYSFKSLVTNIHHLHF